MIRRDDADGSWLLIRQTDHARLSGDLARAWGRAPFRPAEPFEESVYGIGHHDDGWLAWEAAPRADPETGRPLHFTELRLEEHLAIWRRGPAMVGEIHPYAGLLVSRHGVGLMEYKREAPDLGDEGRAALDRYGEEQARLREALAARLPPERRAFVEGPAFEANVRLLQVLDYLSLFLCCGWRDRLAVGRVPGSGGPFAHELVATPCGRAGATFDPWPFAPRPPLVLRVEARRLRAARYDDDGLSAALAAAAPEAIEIVLEAP